MKLPPIPKRLLAPAGMTAADVARALRADGFKPTDAATARLLRESGHLGMPREPLSVPRAQGLLKPKSRSAAQLNGAHREGRKLIQWLKAQGAEPIPPRERARLRKLGFLGMPDE